MTDDLDRRMASIERQNRGLRMCVLALGVAFAASWGWQSVRPAQSQAKQQVVISEDAITLLRPDGTRASEWKVHHTGDAVITFFDRTGNVQMLDLGSSGDAPSLAMANKKNDLLVLLNISDAGDSTLILGGEGNKLAASLSVFEGDVGLVLSDKDGKNSIYTGYRMGHPVVEIQRKDGEALWGSTDAFPLPR